MKKTTRKLTLKFLTVRQLDGVTGASLPTILCTHNCQTNTCDGCLQTALTCQTCTVCVSQPHNSCPSCPGC